MMHGGGGWGGGGGGGWGAGRPGDLDEMIRGQAYDHRVVVRLFKYFSPYKLLVLAALLGMVVYSAVTVGIPWLVKLGIDNYIIPRQLDGLNYLVIVFAVLLVFHFIANYGHQVLITRASQHVLQDLRTELFDYLQQQSMTFHGKYKVGQIMSRAQNDVQALSEFMMLMATGLADMLSLVAVVAAMFILDPLLAAVTLALVPLLVLFLAVWQRFARRTFLRVRYAIARVNGALQEDLSGVRVIQSMNRQSTNMVRFDELNAAHLRTQLDSTALSAGVMPVVESFTGLALSEVVIFGGQLVLRGELEVGVLVAFALFIQRFFDPVRQLTLQYSQMQRAMAAGTRIFELLDVPVDLTDKANAKPLPPLKGAVEYAGVDFAYVQSKPVLTGINLSIKPGEAVALVGSTGAGKTTMVALLARFYDVTNGQLTIDGQDIRDVTRASLAQQMGMVPQEPFLFSATIRENIRYSHREATDEAVETAAKAVGIHDFIMSLPEGYDSMLEERGGNLSIGQRQLMSFARALVADPKILILDEATASVDTETEQVIQRALSTLLAGRTAVVIAHRLSTIRNSDKIVFMEHGRIAEVGTHDELITMDGLYAQHYARYQQESARTNGAGTGAGRRRAPSMG